MNLVVEVTEKNKKSRKKSCNKAMSFLRSMKNLTLKNFNVRRATRWFGNGNSSNGLIHTDQEPTEDAPGSMNITNVNNDCMTSIFEYLDLEDLLCVADSSNEFYTSVCQVFERKYKGADVSFNYNSECSELYIGPSIYPSKNLQIYISNRSTVLKLVRNFGLMLKDLQINFNSFNVKFCAEFECYLARYCSETLQRFSLVCNDSINLFENLYQPLKNLIYLNIFITSWKQLIRCQFVEEHLPQLKHIYIEICLPSNLECYEPGILHFENLESFTTDYSPMRGGFPISFGKLKHLVLLGAININYELCQFLRGIQYLTSLKIMRVRNVSNVSHEDDGFQIPHTNTYIYNYFSKILELPNLLLNLEELLIQVHPNMKPNDIVRFLEHSRSLKILTLFGVFSSWADEIFENISRIITLNMDFQWKYSVVYPFENPFCNNKPSYAFVIEKISE